jgi:hypothetical protein
VSFTVSGEFPVSGSLFSIGTSRARAGIVLLVALVVTAFLALGMSAPASAADPGTLEVRISNEAGALISGLTSSGNSKTLVAIPVSNNEPDGSQPDVEASVGVIPGEYSFALTGGQNYAIAVLGVSGAISELYSSAPVSGASEGYLGYFDDADLVSVASGATQYIDFSLISNVTLKGTVTTTSGHGISGIDVEAYRFDGSNWVDWQSATTSSSGSYSFTGLDAGSYKEDFTDYSTTGYLTQFSGNAATLAAASSVYVGVGGSATVNAKLSVGGKISGKAKYVDGSTFDANLVVPFAYPVTTTVSGGVASVGKSYYWFGNDTGSSGVWTVAGMPAGTYIVKLDDDSAQGGSDNLVDAYVGASGPVLEADQAKVFTVATGKTTSAPTTQLTVVDPTVTDTTDPTRTALTLTVYEPGGTTPLESAFVTLTSTDDNDYYYSSHYGDETDANGQVQFFRAPAGNYTLTVDYGAGNNYGSAAYAPTYQPYVENFTYNGTLSSKSITMLSLTSLGFSTAPSISNSGNLAANVSHTVSAAANQSDAQLSYEWERDGKPIYGADAATYVTQGGDVLHTITALVTVTKNGFNPVAESASLGEVTAGPQIDSGTAPTISSSTTTPEPGSTLSAVGATWTDGGAPLTGVSTSVEWIAIGSTCPSNILGTDSTLVVPACAAHASVYAVVAASKPGYMTSASKLTTTIVISPLAAPTETKAPKVTSKKVTGGTQYTASTGTWSVSGLTYDYDWVLDSSDSDGSSNVFVLPTSEAAQSVTLDLYVSKTGYASNQADGVVAHVGTEVPTVADAGVVHDTTASTSITADDQTVGVGDVLDASVQPTDWLYGNGKTEFLNSYQWYRVKAGTTGTPAKISNATKATYTVGSADIGYKLSVVEKSTYPLFVSASATVVAGLGVVSPALQNAAPFATVQGGATPGDKLTASITSWGVTGVTDSYQWYLCDAATEAATSKDCASDDILTDFGTGDVYAPISKATSSSYTTLQAQAGGDLAVVITGSKSGYASYRAKSGYLQLNAAGSAIAVLTQPNIVDRTEAVGTTLKATSATFDLAGVTTHDEWKVCDGDSSNCNDQSNWTEVTGSGATTTSHTVTPADFGSGNSSIEFTETATKTGYAESAVALSDANPVGLGNASLTKHGSVTVKSTSYTITPPKWSPSGGTVTYAWYENGVLQSDTTSKWTRTSADAGKAIIVDVSYTLSSSLKIATADSVVVAQKGPAPTVASTSAVTIVSTSGPTDPVELGATLELSGDPFTYATTPDDPIDTYQWYVSGVAQKGADGETFTPSAADVGKSITVKETANNYDLTTATFTSAAVTLLGPTPLIDSVAPSITGATAAGYGAVGAQLGVSTGSWNVSGLTFTYQWRIDGQGIPGATSSTFTPLASDYQDDVTVLVTASKAGYVPRADSTQDVAIGLGTIPALTTPPKVTATADFALLVASTGTWKVDGLNFTYQWYRNAIAIDGATAQTWAPQSAGSYSYDITAHRDGYADSDAVTSTALTATPAP